MPAPNPSSAAPPPKPRSRPGPVRWAIAVVLLGLAAWAGWHTYRVFQQRGVVEHIDDLGGVVTYDFDYIDPDNRENRPDGPNPIASLLGNDYTQDIVEVNLRSSDRGALNDEDLEQITSLPELRKLSISNGGEITDEGLEHLARIPKLERLSLIKFSNVTDAGLAVLASLPELRTLELVALPKISDKGLEHLAELENLRELTISNCKINGSGWQYVTAPGLRLIETTMCQVNDAALKHVADAQALEELSVMQNQIKGAGLSHLKGLSKLARLRLGENPLDPSAAVPNLKELTSLELLNLRGTPVDREAGKELAQALPKCDITIDDGWYDPEFGKWDYEAAKEE
jgi:Leucine-rich repeat (LRR) protein